MPTTLCAFESSTASDVFHDPRELSGDVDTHTRVAWTMFASAPSVTVAPQPPATGELRVPNTAYNRPVIGLTDSDDGPPESAHCRSRNAWSVGDITGTGVPKLA